MIPSEAFARSKRMARVELGDRGHEAFLHWADLKRQWETTCRSDKLVELIGAQSGNPQALGDVQARLQPLTAEEGRLFDGLLGLYGRLATMLTSLDTPVRAEVDAWETLLDRRYLAGRVIPPAGRPLRVLDIGPGSGRHMAACALAETPCVYVGIESAGLCYQFQNALAGLLRTDRPEVEFVDGVDYQFARREAPPLDEADGPAIYHLPLWMDHLLPDRAFDLVLCNYVLDELPGCDFERVVNLIQRVLAAEGLVYARGGQLRSMLNNLYEFGYGTYHGVDITKAFLGRGMRVASAELIASQLTRTFARTDATARPAGEGALAAIEFDGSLVEAAQAEFVRAELAGLAEAGAKVAIWGDRGYGHVNRWVAPHLAGAEGATIIGATHRLMSQATVGQIDLPESPPAELLAEEPDAVIIASANEASVVREVRESTPAGEYETVRRLVWPVAVVYRTPPEA